MCLYLSYHGGEWEEHRINVESLGGKVAVATKKKAAPKKAAKKAVKKTVRKAAPKKTAAKKTTRRRVAKKAA